MDLVQRVRFLAASAFSPLVVPLMVQYIFTLVYGDDINKNNELMESIDRAIWFSYFLTVMFSVPAYIVIRHYFDDEVKTYLVAGLAVGFLAWLTFSLFSSYFVTLLFFVFALAGTALGGIFWLLLYFQPDGNYSRSRRSRRKRRV